jgi:hypothetical protein
MSYLDAGKEMAERGDLSLEATAQAAAQETSPATTQEEQA